MGRCSGRCCQKVWQHSLHLRFRTTSYLLHILGFLLLFLFLIFLLFLDLCVGSCSSTSRFIKASISWILRNDNAWLTQCLLNPFAWHNSSAPTSFASTFVPYSQSLSGITVLPTSVLHQLQSYRFPQQRFFSALKVTIGTNLNWCSDYRFHQQSSSICHY